ncbi:MAG: type II secretion system protein [Thermoanaerobaculia bacterium]
MNRTATGESSGVSSRPAGAAAPKLPSPFRQEEGFTLAALLVIITIIGVLVAYTVPQMWSQVLKRDREKQTIFVMRQYAQAIQNFQAKHGGLPTSLDQLSKQQKPRVLRQLYKDPLTGKLDWILIPMGAQVPGAPGSAVPGGPAAPRRPQRPGNSAPGEQPNKPQNLGTPGKQVGPFIGVRPNATGDSFLTLNGANRYEDWVYTIYDLQKEKTPATPTPGTPVGAGPVTDPNSLPNGGRTKP